MAYVKKGFVLLTNDGDYVMSLADKKFCRGDTLSDATVYNIRELADVMQGPKKDSLLIDGEMVKVVTVEAYSTRMVTLGVPQTTGEF